MKKLRYLAVFGALLTVTGAMAVPAKRVTFTATQPDGTQVTLTRAGDEFNKYFLTDDGQVVVGSEVKGYYFAEADATTGRMKASAVQAADSKSRNAVQKAFVEAIDRDGLSQAMTLKAASSRIAPKEGARSLRPQSKTSVPAQSGIGLFPGTTFPKTGSPKGLVILVQYTDVKFNSSYDPTDYFPRMIGEKGFKDNGATGSALDYFTDASMGKFTPDFDVYGPVTLSQKQSYYGGNDSYGDDKAPEEMVIEGCKLLDSQVDFSQYDTDGDGVVDNVFVFYAGRGEADGGGDNTVWPHSWEISSAGKTLTLDGVQIDRYACSNEWDGSKPDAIGTFVHEFSHVMGLPDLYHTSSTVYYTPCEWSVMDYGPYNNDSRTPPTYSIFERNAMGWIDPTVLDGDPISIELKHIETSNEGCIIPTSSTNEFFLLENRQQSGWDTYLPGHGMLIWHIDYNSTIWNNNSVNNTKSHQYVDIEEANNNPAGNSASAIKDWAFPGSTGKYTSFTDDTTPSMKTWSGKGLNTPITNIAETNGLITFDVCGGGTSIEAPTPVTPGSDQIGSDYFIASWQPVDDAVDYLLTVSAAGELITTTDNCDFGTGNTAKLPDGWSASGTLASYSTTGNYGQASPSLKMSVKGYTLTTPEYEYPVTKISFWAKGQGQTNNTLSIYAVNGSTKTLVATLSSWNSKKGETVSCEINSDDAYQLQLVYNKTSGNLAIDDIEITTSSAGEAVLPAYNEASTNGATSMRVSNLPAGKTLFSYTVKAVNSEGKKSKASAPVEVDLSRSGVDAIGIDDTDAPVEYYNLQGIKVANPANGIYIRRQGARVEKVIM